MVEYSLRCGGCKAKVEIEWPSILPDGWSLTHYADSPEPEHHCESCTAIASSAVRNAYLLKLQQRNAMLADNGMQDTVNAEDSSSTVITA